MLGEKWHERFARARSAAACRYTRLRALFTATANPPATNRMRITCFVIDWKKTVLGSRNAETTASADLRSASAIENAAWTSGCKAIHAAPAIQVIAPKTPAQSTILGV